MSDKVDYGKSWEGGGRPYVASYGKLMMWFFLITDTLTFSAFLAGYGFSRFKYPDIWPTPEDVFTHFPFFTWRSPFIICSFNDIYSNYELCDDGSCSKLWS
jgi:cytochrome c oxidase subunit 3